MRSMQKQGRPVGRPFSCMWVSYFLDFVFPAVLFFEDEVSRRPFCADAPGLSGVLPWKREWRPSPGCSGEMPPFFMSCAAIS